MAKLNTDIVLKLVVWSVPPPPPFKVFTASNRQRTSLCMFITMSQAPKANYPFVLQQPTIHSNEFKIEWFMLNIIRPTEKRTNHSERIKYVYKLSCCHELI